MTVCQRLLSGPHNGLSRGKIRLARAQVHNIVARALQLGSAAEHFDDAEWFYLIHSAQKMNPVAAFIAPGCRPAILGQRGAT